VPDGEDDHRSDASRTHPPQRSSTIRSLASSSLIPSCTPPPAGFARGRSASPGAERSLCLRRSDCPAFRASCFAHGLASRGGRTRVESCGRRDSLARADSYDQCPLRAPGEFASWFAGEECLASCGPPTGSRDAGRGAGLPRPQARLRRRPPCFDPHGMMLRHHPESAAESSGTASKAETSEAWLVFGRVRCPGECRIAAAVPSTASWNLRQSGDHRIPPVGP